MDANIYNDKINNKKKKRKSKKKADFNPTNILSTANNPPPDGSYALSDKDMTPEVKEYINALLQNQLETEAKEFQRRKLKSIDADQIKNILSEYLDTFLILGYDTKGERVFVFNADTPAKKDALYEHFKSIFVKLLEQQQKEF